MQLRQLDFKDFSQVLADVEQLQRAGYERAGQWDLAQVCEHVTYFMKGSLDGHPYRVPWVFKVLFGRLVLRRILNAGKMKPGAPTPQKPLPAPGGDVATAVAGLKDAITRLQAHAGELHASPFFGYLTPEQWRDLHLIHCAHHLAFLAPKGATA